MKTIFKHLPLLLLGVIVGGLLAINAGLNPLLSIVGSIAFLKLTDIPGLIPYGSLAVVMQAGTYNWTGKDVETIFFRPRYTGMKPEELGFRVVFTAQSKIRLHFFGAVGKVLLAYASGFQGGSASAKHVREFIVQEFKAEIAYDKHDYDGMMHEMLFRDGISQNDIDGTAVMNAEKKVFDEAISSDTWRYFWLGDTAKLHIAAGTYPDGTTYAIGDPDKYYNKVNGVLTELIANASATPTADQVKYIAMPVSLATDDAMEIMKSVYQGSKTVLKKLKEKGALRYYVTDNFLENYLETLRSTGTEQAHANIVNGVPVYKYNGIQIINIGIDEHIDADFASSFPQDFCLLTTPENLALVLNASDSQAQVRMWFNPDENERRHRAQFKMKPDFVLPELCTIAYYS